MSQKGLVSAGSLVLSIRKDMRAKSTAYGLQVRLSIDRHGVVITHPEQTSNIADPDTLAHHFVTKIGSSRQCRASGRRGKRPSARHPVRRVGWNVHGRAV
jgi:hypothetical protein